MEGDGIEPKPYDGVVTAFLAPFLVCYVRWVLDQALQRGIKRLYFVARDGEVMYKIARQLKRPGDDIEMRYLYGSRRRGIPQHSHVRHDRLGDGLSCQEAKF